jgi:hypothetical protein
MNLATWENETVKDYFLSRVLWMIPATLLGVFIGWQVGKLQCNIAKALTSPTTKRKKRRK